MNRADEDFECENLTNGKPCGKQSPDVQLRPSPVLKGLQYYICDACLAIQQELADQIKKREEKNG